MLDDTNITDVVTDLYKFVCDQNIPKWIYSTVLKICLNKNLVKINEKQSSTVEKGTHPIEKGRIAKIKRWNNGLTIRKRT